ncbi:substrate-binding domain-containing protein [Rhizobium sp. CG5]|uniref:substrate-binding domain-containing protein n=1 Tax=Rhizobium sp. CG5 TaxID=2726076 RepID=UPI00203439C5
MRYRYRDAPPAILIPATLPCPPQAEGQFIRPPLTTLHLPLFEMGAMAVEMIYDIAGGLKSSHDQLKVECALVERESV